MHSASRYKQRLKQRYFMIGGRLKKHEEKSQRHVQHGLVTYVLSPPITTEHYKKLYEDNPSTGTFLFFKKTPATKYGRCWNVMFLRFLLKNGAEFCLLCFLEARPKFQ